MLVDRFWNRTEELRRVYVHAFRVWIVTVPLFLGSCYRRVALTQEAASWRVKFR